METQFYTLDIEKAVEVILYIAKRAPRPDIYHVCKILYFADKKHLERYGRFICGESYVAMKNGPVPSGVYDILKYVRGDGKVLQSEHARNSFGIEGRRVFPFRDANLAMLSESDRECLDESIIENGNLPFDGLLKKSHDAAFNSADENDFIPIQAIASTLRDADLIIAHLRNGY
ncbi:MAG: Panacea domain-containing protein [bacterium]